MEKEMAFLAQVSTSKVLTSVLESQTGINIRDGYNAPGYLNLGFLSTTEVRTSSIGGSEGILFITGSGVDLRGATLTDSLTNTITIKDIDGRIDVTNNRISSSVGSIQFTNPAFMGSSPSSRVFVGASNPYTIAVTDDATGITTFVNSNLLTSNALAVLNIFTGFLAGGNLDSNGNTLAFSKDGYSWEGRGSTFLDQYVNAFSYNFFDGTIVAGGVGTSNVLIYSYNTVDWFVPTAEPIMTEVRCVANNGSQWIIGGRGTNTLAEGPGINGLTDLGSNVFDDFVAGVAWGLNKWVAVGASATTGNTIAYSYDGSNWVGLGSTIFDVAGLCVKFNGFEWVAGGVGTTNTMAYSSDGISWTGAGIVFSQSTLCVDFDESNPSNWWAGGVGGSNVVKTTDTSSWNDYSSFYPDIGAVYGTSSRNSSNLDIVLSASGLTFTKLLYTGGAVIEGNLFVNVDTKAPNGTQLFVDGLTKNTGINCNTPQRKLDVNGEAYFTSISTIGITATDAFFRSTISTHSLVVYGSTTLTVQGNFIMEGGMQASPLSTIGETTEPIFVAVGNPSESFNFTNPDSIKYSYDGSNWEPALNGFRDTTKGVAFNGSNLWVSVGNVGANSPFGIKYSSNGRNWSNAISGFTDYGGEGIAYYNGLWVVVGYVEANYAGNIQYSGDGNNWSNAVTGAFSNGGRGVAHDGAGLWVAVGANPDTLKYSADGSNWSNSVENFYAAGLGVAFGEDAAGSNLWVAVGEDISISNIKYSADGSNWTTVSGFGGYGAGVAFGKDALGSNLWVAVGVGNGEFGSGSNIKYSGDGSNWSNCASGDFSSSGRGVTYSDSFNLWIAVGTDSSNSVRYSGNGSNWSNSVSGMADDNNMYGVASGTTTIQSYTSYKRYNVQNAGLITASTLVLADDSDITPTIPNTTRLALYSGTAFQPLTAFWNTLSDKQIKRNISSANLDLCYTNIQKLPLHRFAYESRFAETTHLKDKHVLGVIAQEVSTIFPKSITQTSGYGYDTLLTINQDQIQMSLLGAVKKLMEDKERLEARVSTMESYFSQMK